MDDRTKLLTRMWLSAQPIVASFVSALVPDFSARDDVVQEVIAAVIESFDSYEPSKPFLSWVLGIARNQVGLYRRRIRRDRLVFDEEAIDLLEASFANLPLNEVHQLEFLQGCLERLSERDRQICDLRYERDLKPAGIATIVGMTPGAVSRALRRIRDQLKDCIHFRTIQIVQ